MRHSSNSILFLLLTAVGCGTEQAGPPPRPAPTMTIAQPVVKQIVEWDAYTGRLEPIDFVEVRARVSGYLQTAIACVVQEELQRFDSARECDNLILRFAAELQVLGTIRDQSVHVAAIMGMVHGGLQVSRAVWNVIAHIRR